MTGEKPYKGVFWVIEQGNAKKLLAFPFYGDETYGVAKSGDTFNHRLLWESVRPKGCSRAFDYYPRGRVELTGQGRAVIYMSPYVSAEFIPEIKSAFGLGDNFVVKLDFSKHYRCYLSAHDSL